ncbi:hypothetical protein [Streptomyces sp. DW26H14]|uniref:hypothetical protein n=1 Tax=Streptomyces sp. DW26H14 TaxID=3435395 RepID=UPI00403DAA84
MAHRKDIARQDLNERAGGNPHARRVVAVGTITHHSGRTLTVRATPAGVTGTITPAGGAR